MAGREAGGGGREAGWGRGGVITIILILFLVLHTISLLGIPDTSGEVVPNKVIMAQTPAQELRKSKLF